MTDPNTQTRLPLYWTSDDPEPDERVRVVSTGRGAWDRWRRVSWGQGEYRWWNGDRLRPWRMVVDNWGGGRACNTARLSAMRRLYDRKRRSRR